MAFSLTDKLLGTGFSTSGAASGVSTGAQLGTGSSGLGLDFGRTASAASEIGNFGYDITKYDPNSSLSRQLLGDQMSAGSNFTGGAPDLGDSGMDFKTKMNMGMDIAKTGLDTYLGLRQARLGDKQYKADVSQFNQNMDMQKNMVRLQLSENYARSLNPTKLGASEAEYMAKYGL